MDEKESAAVNAAIDTWFNDVRLTIGPQISTDTFNRLHSMVPDLKDKLAAAVTPTSKE